MSRPPLFSLLLSFLLFMVLGFFPEGAAAAPTRGSAARKRAEEAPRPVRSSALRESRPARPVARQGETEVERTAAISRRPAQESVIQRRDDQTPTITSPPPVTNSAAAPEVVIDIRRQRLLLRHGGKTVKTYPVSTSRFGIGDRYHSYKTPVGRFKVDGKIGGNLPIGAVLKQGRFTGEILQPNAPGRDPIVTRVIRLRGLERRNSNAYGRGIFIHGTPDEKRIGQAVSWGCVRMRSADVVDLYARIGDGTQVTILQPDERAPREPSWFARMFGAGGDDSGT